MLGAALVQGFPAGVAGSTAVCTCRCGGTPVAPQMRCDKLATVTTDFATKAGPCFTIPPTLSYWAVAFANEHTGWLVGTSGRILRIDF